MNQVVISAFSRMDSFCFIPTRCHRSSVIKSIMKLNWFAESHPFEPHMLTNDDPGLNDYLQNKSSGCPVIDKARVGFIRAYSQLLASVVADINLSPSSLPSGMAATQAALSIFDLFTDQRFVIALAQVIYMSNDLGRANGISFGIQDPYACPGSEFIAGLMIHSGDYIRFSPDPEARRFVTHRSTSADTHFSPTFTIYTDQTVQYGKDKYRTSLREVVAYLLDDYGSTIEEQPLHLKMRHLIEGNLEK